jgi:WD40 repeat protein
VVWSVVEKQSLAETSVEASRNHWRTVVDSNRRRALLLFRDDDRISVDALGFDGEHENLGTLDFEVVRDEAGRWTTIARFDDRAGECLGVLSRNEVFVVDVGDHELGPPRLLGEHIGALPNLDIDPSRRWIATADEDGEFRFWDLNGASPPIVFQGPPNSPSFRFAAEGSLFEAAAEENGYLVIWPWSLSENLPRFLRLFNTGGKGSGSRRWDSVGRRLARSGPDSKFRIWSVDAPFDAEPLVLSRGDNQRTGDVSFDPQGGWLATGDNVGLAFWPLPEQFPIVIRKHDGEINGLTFAPDGSWLASSSEDGTVRLWPLEGDPPLPGSTLVELDNRILGLAASPDGERILAGTHGKGTRLLRPGGGPSVNLEGFYQRIMQVAFSPDGRLAAGVGGQFIPEDRMIRIWNVETGEEVTVLEFGEQPIVNSLQFISDEHLLSTSESGLLQWNITTGERKLLYEGNFKGAIMMFAASTDGRRVLMIERDSVKNLFGKVVLLDLDSGTISRLDRFGDDVTALTLDPTGTFAVTGDLDGEVRVGPVTGEDTHLLLGHEGTVWTVAIDPLGRWIASGGQDKTIRLWPMPDLSKPPLHTLPREELIAKLKTLTNLRVVEAPESPSGWKLDIGPFPGWETVPTW